MATMHRMADRKRKTPAGTKLVQAYIDITTADRFKAAALAEGVTVTDALDGLMKRHADHAGIPMKPPYLTPRRPK